jgi:extradiol dioxygenase family protein
MTSSAERPPFHLAFPVNDLVEARRFYGELLGCPEGRSSDRWVDFNFFGHQIVAHLSDDAASAASNQVDGDAVPVRHFGVVLQMSEWRAIAKRLKDAHAKFIIKPHVRFTGQKGEQATLFVLDPSGNALEFKAFRNMDQLFEKQDEKRPG